MKKISILLMLMALFGPLAMNADEKTVYDGTGTNVYVPFYSYYADYGTRSQFIIPASELTDLNGADISKLTFYYSTNYTFDEGVTVYLKEVNYTTFSSNTLEDWNTMTSVWTGTLVVSNKKLEISFTSPYTYGGGNLMIGFQVTTWGSTCPSGNSWTGVTQSSNTALYNNANSSHNWTSTITAAKFLPKTTFTYTPASGSCASGCECFENCTALTGTGSGGSGSTPAANLPTNWKGYGANYYPFAATFTSYMGNTADGQFMYFKATDSNATYLALPTQYVTEVNFDYAYETNAYGTNVDALQLEIGYMTDISSSTWYNNTFYSLKTMTNNGDTWGSETADFSSVTASTYYVVFKFSQTQGSWYSAAIDNVCVTTNAPDPCDKTIPYTYGFEDASDFSCWTTVDCESCSNNSSLYGLYTSSSYAHNGSKLFVFSSYCGETDPQYLISPKLRGVQNGVHVEFDYATVNFAQGAPETFQVGYSTTTNSVNSFTWVDSRTCTSSTYEHFSANYMGNVKYVAVKYTSADSYYLFLDDFIIEEAPNCLEPTNVVASNETTTSATIGWTAGGSETEWDLYYTSNPSDVPTASTTPSVSGITTNYRNLTSLTAATTYYVYVRAACSSTETSAWSNPCIFNTECYEMALPYSYGFEDGALSVCWTPINESPVYMSIEVTTTNPRTGSYHLNLDRRTPNGTQIIVLPEVDATYALSNYEVSFYAMLSNGGNSDYTATGRTLTIGVMTDPMDESTFVAVGSAVTPTSSYAQYTFDLSSYTGNGQYIAIKHDESSSGNNGYTYIDDLQINALPCPVPSGLSATNITAASATLDWTGDQSYYNVRYRSVIAGAATTTTEDFEGQTAASYSATGELPNGWNSYTTNDYKPHVSNNSSYSYISNHSGNYLLMTTNGSATGSVYAIMPKYENLTAVSFYYVFESTSSCGTLEVGYVTDNTGYSTFQRLGDAIQPATTWSSNPYTLSSSDISTINSVGGYVAFKYNSNSSTYYSAAIDNVVVTTQAITYGAWVNKTNVASQLPINDLTPTIENGIHLLPTTYEWQVQGVNCDGNGGTTDWSAPATFTTLEGYVKPITGYGTGAGCYYLIASPIGDVAPTDVANMINKDSEGHDTQTGYDLYYFDHALDMEWVTYKQQTGASNPHFDLETGTGYLYANSQNVTLVFTGQAHNTQDMEIELNLTETASGYTIDLPGWNLVGNPYAELAYIDIVSEERPFYTMNGGGTAFEAVTGGSIDPMEGIFVVAEEDGETMTFTTTEPTSKGKGLALNLSDSHNRIDRAIVRFNKGRTLPKLMLFENSSKIYIPVDGKDYAVVRSEEVGEMPVNFKAENNGSYTLSLSVDNVEFGYLHLIDNMTGMDIDLLQTPSYTFEAKTTDYESRFKLVFATGNNSKDDNFAYFSNGSFVINNDGEATLQVIDIMGRILKSENINGCANMNVNAAPGVYMLRLVNGDNVKVQKVVVK